MQTDTISISDFVKQHKIRATVIWADNNPNMEDSPHMHRHFKVTLYCGQSQMTVYFSQGDAHTEEPTAEDVLDCLALDAGTIENARSFEDWAAELGYDTDSRKAEKIFKTVEKQTDKLKRLLDPEAYEQLLWHTERQ